LQTPDLGFGIIGYSNNYVQSSQDLGDIYFIKVDQNANLQWYKTYGGIGFHFAYGIDNTKDGGYVISAISNRIDPHFDFYLLKTDGFGNMQWEKFIDNGNDNGGYVKSLSDGSIIAASSYGIGANKYESVLLKFDINGNSIFTKKYLYGLSFSIFGPIVENTDGSINLTAMNYKSIEYP
jgi:hypothetical protein